MISISNIKHLWINRIVYKFSVNRGVALGHCHIMMRYRKSQPSNNSVAFITSLCTRTQSESRTPLSQRSARQLNVIVRTPCTGLVHLTWPSEFRQIITFTKSWKANTNTEPNREPKMTRKRRRTYNFKVLAICRWKESKVSPDNNCYLRIRKTW